MTTELHEYLISYKALRRLIGVLGLLLPFLCWGFNAIVNHLNLLSNPFFVNESQTLAYTAGADLKSSVSLFYYTAAGPLFTGVLVTLAIFLFCYNGYPQNKAEDRFAWLTDKRLAAFAACCSLAIVFIPAGSHQPITDNIYIFVSSKPIGMLHLLAATLFFLSMATMSIVNFRRLPGKRLLKDTEGKLYVICGVGIIICLPILAIHFFVVENDNWLGGKFVFVMEVIMLTFFSTAWLLKGKSVATELLLKNIKL